jgi:hypothetical protein
VSWPENIEEEIRNFYGIVNFPHVCEVVDIILFMYLFCLKRIISTWSSHLPIFIILTYAFWK